GAEGGVVGIKTQAISTLFTHKNPLYPTEDFLFCSTKKALTRYIKLKYRRHLLEYRRYFMKYQRYLLKYHRYFNFSQSQTTFFSAVPKNFVCREQKNYEAFQRKLPSYLNHNLRQSLVLTYDRGWS
ncbi:MAG: hypothetical protein IJP36_01830, partial [Bacteroides sp.]|nr:hypothetical protein [Bacteroides sp.]